MNIFCTHIAKSPGETEKTRRVCVACSFVSLMLILMMMMMFRTVLLFFPLLSLSLCVCLCRYITGRKKKTDPFLKDGTTCLFVARSGLNSAIVMFLSFFFFSPLQKNSSLFFGFSSFFAPYSLTLVIMFTIACIMLLCAYFQGSLLRFCLTCCWEKNENRNKKKKKPRSCITRIHG